jgi:hypothetical protein
MSKGKRASYGKSVLISQLQKDSVNPRELKELMQNAGRIALRVEGDFYNAYYALPDSMKGAIFIGCIRVALIKNDEVRRMQFLDFVRAAIEELLKDRGHNIVWGGEQPALEGGKP